MKYSLILLATSMMANSAIAAVIGYGSSNAVLPSKNQEFVYMGFELGILQHVSEKAFTELVEIRQSSNGKQLEAQNVARDLIKGGARLLIGFPTSHEALLTTKIARENNVMAVFAGASHSDLATMGPMVYTTGESMEYAVRSTLDFIQKRFPSRKGALIGNPFAVFSKNQDDHYLKLLQEPTYSNMSIDHLTIRSDTSLSPESLEKLQTNHYAYLIITPYADESGKILSQLEKQGIDLPLIANSSWTTGDVDLIRRFLTHKREPAYCSSFTSPTKSKDYRKFSALFFSRFGKSPTAESSYGYDLGLLIGKLLKQTGKNPSAEDFRLALLKNPCVENTSSGKFCFPGNGGHAIRKLNMLKFNKQGFKSIE